MSRGKKLGILLVVMVVAFAAFFGARKLAERAEDADKTSVMNIAAKDITGLKWTYEGETITLVKADGKWSCEGDSEFVVNDSKAQELAETVANLKAAQVISKEEQSGSYGLDEPSSEIVVSTATADTTYSLGDLNDTTNEYYLKVTGSESVFMVPQSFGSAFELSRDAVEATPTPAPTDTPAPTESAEPQTSAEPEATPTPEQSE